MRYWHCGKRSLMWAAENLLCRVETSEDAPTDLVENTETGPQGVLSRVAPTPSGAFAHLDAFRERSQIDHHPRSLMGNVHGARNRCVDWDCREPPKRLDTSVETADTSVRATCSIYMAAGAAACSRRRMVMKAEAAK